jgi:hypothetical protein
VKEKDDPVHRFASNKLVKLAIIWSEVLQQTMQMVVHEKVLNTDGQSTKEYVQKVNKHK